MLACGTEVREDRHFDRAQTLMFEIDAKYSDKDYLREDYVAVLDELEQVSREFVHYDDVREMMSTISKHRIAALKAREEKRLEKEAERQAGARRIEEYMGKLKEIGANALVEEGAMDYHLALLEGKFYVEDDKLILTGRAMNIGKQPLQDPVGAIELGRPGASGQADDRRVLEPAEQQQVAGINRNTKTFDLTAGLDNCRRHHITPVDNG